MKPATRHNENSLLTELSTGRTSLFSNFLNRFSYELEIPESLVSLRKHQCFKHLWGHLTPLSGEKYFDILNSCSNSTTEPIIKLQSTYSLLLLPNFLLFSKLSIIERANWVSLADITALSVFKALDFFLFIVINIIRNSLLYLNEFNFEERIRNNVSIWSIVPCTKLTTKLTRTKFILFFFYRFYQSSEVVASRWDRVTTSW